MVQGTSYDATFDRMNEPGSFSWNISTNTLYGDGTVAELYGLNPEDVFAGLPLEVFTEKIHSNDRPAVARAIHTAITTGEPYNACFRITAENMATVAVIACRRCFRDHHGVPTIFSGIVFPAADSTSPDDTLLSQMVSAHQAAIEEGNTEIATGLKFLVDKLAAKRNRDGSYASH